MRTINKEKSKLTIDFDILIQSMTIADIKDVINYYNENFVVNGEMEEKLSGYSGLKKSELIDYVIKSISDEDKKKIFEIFEPEFTKKLVEDALSLIAGEHKTEKILNAGMLPGGKGYQVWFQGRNWTHRAKVRTDFLDDIRNSCNCKFGRHNGICLHEIAIYLMLLSKKMLSVNDIPLNLKNDWFLSIQKRLDLIASQSLFKEEPAIVLDEDYNIYVYENFVTLEWGGRYPGKTTKDMNEEGDNIDNWLAKKVTNLILRKIKIKKKEGKPIKILIDSYGIIEKILENPKLVNKIMKKFSVLDNPNLPKKENELEKFLKRDLKENVLEIDMEPPFEAYMGAKPYAFVSYTHKDKAQVYPIIYYLSKKGVNIWYDEGIPLTVEWEKFIMERLDNSKLFLNFITPNILDSENTLKEIKKAINNKKPYLGVYLMETNLPEELKIIRKYQGLEKYAMSDEKFNEKLIEQIEEIIK